MAMEYGQETNFEEYMPAPSQTKSVTTEAMVGRQMQEVKAAVFMAKQYPRDPYTAFQRIMTACERKILAESAVYEFPRGTERVSGPSIRLAEVLAQNWGNMDSGVIELEQKPGESVAMAYAWDLETNVRETKVFTVKHERHTKKGVQKLTDPRDIYELVANNGARRRRACILSIIPGDIVDAAVEKCSQTLSKGHTEPLEDRLRSVLLAFDTNFGVKKEHIEKHFGYGLDSFTEKDLARLKKIGLALRDGMAKREDYFDIKGTTAASASSTTDSIIADFEKAQKGAADSHGDAAEQSELPLE